MPASAVHTAHILGILIAMAGTSALAASYRDAASGIGVTAPPGYTVTTVQNKIGSPAIDLAKGKEAHCQIRFHRDPSDASVEAINATASDTLEASASNLTLTRFRPIVLGGYRGLQFDAEPTKPTGRHNWFALFLTQKGRINVICDTALPKLAMAQPEFDAIVHSIDLPH